ncbi:PDDEXK nuclease domain-containing protein [Sphingobacterium kitahiroshimense]|uniref:PDDEXK nuclease domain-containing protein n=1 Tax=Sphingobacterium kitahiroshimense TaxID=470446 RepID=UPI0032088223
MLELGNGFSFVSRQKRIHLVGDEFFVDLDFYNVILFFAFSFFMKISSISSM